jgi:hypothetical protein
MIRLKLGGIFCSKDAPHNTDERENFFNIVPRIRKGFQERLAFLFFVIIQPTKGNKWLAVFR